MENIWGFECEEESGEEKTRDVRLCRKELFHVDRTR